MPGTTPIIQEGTLIAGANTFLVPARRPGLHQLLLENTDPTNAFTMRLNDSTEFDGLTPSAKTIIAGTRIGLVVSQGILKIVLTPVTGLPTYSILVA